MKLAPKSKLVMIGDSITDCGRSRPIGEGLFDAQGKGYVSLVSGRLNVAYPGHLIRVVNVGNSGDTVVNLKQRWQTDVLDQKPDWLSIMIGTNDVWRQFDLPHIPELHVHLEQYETGLEELVRSTRPQLKGLVMMTPFFMEPNKQDAMRARMDQYGAVVKKLAAKYDAIFVDTQAAFDKVLEHVHSAAIGWDRVHPNTTGHIVLSEAFLKAIEI